MRTVHFSDCFGWLHTAKNNRNSDLAVVLCAGFHMDMMAGYRQLRILADALAQTGMPVLRFHYPGTGNSLPLKNADGWPAWQDSIHAAIDNLRAWTGARRVVLVGVRLGALLAASIADKRSDLAALILLAPVFRGRTFVRQLDVEQKTASAHVPGNRPPLFPIETLQRISQQTLSSYVVPSGCAVDVYAKSESTALKDCLRTWEKAGVTAAHFDFTGLDPVLRPTFMNHQLSIDTNGLVERIRGYQSSQAPDQVQVNLPSPAVIVTDHWTETPLHFGANNALFGILCRPAASSTQDVAVVLANSGGDAHCASAGVEVARRLAENGIASFRIDFAGIGDSIAPGDAPTHVFELNRDADFSAAIDALSVQNYRRFAAYGICSGAYHAYYAAQSDRRVRSVFLVNMPFLQWDPSQLVEALDIRAVPPNRLVQEFMTRDAWLTALHDGNGLREWSVRCLRWLVKRLLALSSVIRSRRTSAIVDDAALRHFVRHTHMLCLFADNDPGIPIILAALGSDRRSPDAYVEISQEIDHSLSDSTMHRFVADRMTRFLQSY